MSERYISCSDITTHDPGYMPANCCDSCHDDEDEGWDSLWQQDWLNCCCAQLRTLDQAGVNAHDEAAVRAYVAQRKGTA